MRRLLAPIVFAAGLPAATAFADCSSPAAAAGATAYAANIATMVYCDGTHWVSMAGGVSATIGGNITNIPGGSSGQVQYNNGSGGFAGDSGMTYSGGLLTVSNISTTNLNAGNVTAAAFYGDGSHLTGISASAISGLNGDRIASGSTSIVANSTSIISITTNGVTDGYFNSNGVLTVPGISATANLTSVTTLYTSGNVGIGTATGGAKLDIQAADLTNGIYVRRTGGGITHYLSIDASGNGYMKLRNGAGSDAVSLNTNGNSYLSGGYVGIGNTSPQNLLTVGGQAGQSNAVITARGGSSTGNALEWGHSNLAGYGSVLGFEEGDGIPFICFSCEAGSTNNTYHTRGAPGSVLKANLSGGFIFGAVTSSNADNQSYTQTMSLTSGGVLTVNGASTCTIGNGTGATNCTSDRRLKKDIAPIQDALAKLERLNGVTFHWKDPKKSGPEHIGVIAQDVEKVFPQAVGEVSDTMLGTAKTVDIAILVAPLIEAVKELKAQNIEAVKELKGQNDDLQRQINRLKAARK